MKDGPAGDEIVSRLVPVDVGTDDDGLPITSCLVHPVERAEPPRARSPKLSAANARALELLVDAIARHGEVPPASNHIPIGKLCISKAVWRDACYRGTVSDSDKPDAKRKAFARAANELVAAGRVGTWDNLFWVVLA